MGFNFSKENRPPPPEGTHSILVSCSWSPAARGRVPYDLDCHAFGLVHPEERMEHATLYRPQFGSYPLALTYANDDLVPLPNLGHEAYQTPDGSMVHFGDSLDGHGEGSDEELCINLHLLPECVNEVAIWVTLQAAPKRKETMEWVGSAFVRVVDMMTKNELCYFPLKEKFTGARSVHVASFVREGGKWTFTEVGVGNDANLERVIEAYKKKGVADIEGPEDMQCTDVRSRTLRQFHMSRAISSGTPLAQLDMADLAAIDPNASEDILREALRIVKSFSEEDPDTRFALFGTDVQNEYGRLMSKALKLGRDSRFRWARESLSGLLELIDSVDFSSLLEEPEPVGGWDFLLNWFRRKPERKPTLTRSHFDDAERKVRRKKKSLEDRQASLEELHSDIVGLEHQRMMALDSIHAHVIAGKAVCFRLHGTRKANLETRVQALQVTAMKGKVDQQCPLLLMIVNAMMHSIQDTMLTWLPVWLSTGNETFALLQSKQLTPDAEALGKAMEARTTILTEGNIPLLTQNGNDTNSRPKLLLEGPRP